jgi:hypothetical protein
MKHQSLLLDSKQCCLEMSQLSTYTFLQDIALLLGQVALRLKMDRLLEYHKCTNRTLISRKLKVLLRYKYMVELNYHTIRCILQK